MSAVLQMPAPLQPWRLWLDWFDPQIAAQLGPWLVRLDPLLGRASRLRRQDGDSEPDGIDDLRRRGSYEHLLLSEWALADALPEEFLRRASHAEHLFLVPRMQTRTRDARLVAIFDAGPAQWGAPRLAQIALWILLARRAQAANARLVWGLAHLPGELHDADSPARLQQLLQGRTFEATGTQHAHAWATQLATATPTTSECWWIGAQPVRAAPFHHQASIAPAADAHLQVGLQTRHGTRSSLLPVPASMAATQLLRGHFIDTQRPAEADAAKHVVKGKFSLRHAPLFSPDGSHVALLLADGYRSAMVKVQPADSVKRAAPRYHQWTQGGQLLCLAAQNKHVGGIVAIGQQAECWNLDGMPRSIEAGGQSICPVPGQVRLRPCVWLNSGGQPQRFLLWDQHGRLMSWTRDSAQRQRVAHGSEIAGQVVALAQGDAEHAVYATHVAGELRLLRLHRTGKQDLVLQLALGSRPPVVLLRNLVQEGQWRGAIAVELASRQAGGDRSLAYRVLHGGPADGFQEFEAIVASGDRAIGLIGDPDAPQHSLLLVLRADRRALLAIGATGRRTLHRAASEISAAAVSSDGAQVALVTLQGQAWILGDGGLTPLMVVQGQAEQPGHD